MFSSFSKHSCFPAFVFTFRHFLHSIYIFQVVLKISIAMYLVYHNWWETLPRQEPLPPVARVNGWSFRSGCLLPVWSMSTPRVRHLLFKFLVFLFYHGHVSSYSRSHKVRRGDVDKIGVRTEEGRLSSAGAAWVRHTMSRQQALGRSPTLAGERRWEDFRLKIRGH